VTPRRARSVTVPLLFVLMLSIGCQPARGPLAATTPHVTDAPRTTAVPSTGSASPSAPRSTTARPTVQPNPGGLTDDRLVGQLFMAYVYGSSANQATPAQRAANLALYGAATGAEVIRRWHLGGIILLDHNNLDPNRPELSTGNVNSAAQITVLTASLQRAALADSGIPLLIATDQEGGSVQRITDGVSWRPAQEQIAGLSEQQLRCGYVSLGRQLRQLGVNQDFAPVADVVRTATGVIGDRSFGPDPMLDARDIVAAVTGLQQGGVLATLKHWPGHGSTSTDSHAALAVIHESVAEWKAVDRQPFLAGGAVAASVMVGHLAFPALDPSGAPATLSPQLVDGALRRDLGFRGLVVTDSLWMEPALAAGSAGQVARLALAAGDDMLLMSPDVPAAYKVILALVRSDPKLRARVQASVGRILAAKARLKTPPSTSGSC
jgi:beta-N-acetylhexosaminidase